MAYTYEELSKKTVAQLREIAAGLDHESLKGSSQLHKHEILPKLCAVLGIDMHAHHRVVGINKTEVKAKIRQLKARREELLASGNREELKQVRREIHALKRQLRRSMV
ncbi:MAG: hypothetical protein Kow001_18280 [Acidobacteriota bacterium]